MKQTDKRLHNSVSLAGPLIDRGLTAEDADALLGIMLLRTKSATRFIMAIKGWRSRRLIDLIPEMIARDGSFFANLAQQLRWQERKSKYEKEKLAWEAAEADNFWRSKPMTLGQRYLVQSTASLLLIEIPAGLDRGGASDWLDTHMAHLVLMIDESMQEDNHE